ncbi:MAG TPA: hypothetical protein VG433_04535 [Pirellulales bacterium]|jgi:hypothetical protein|nr:hypothetical protein [Pirellulales bacterium]
MSIRIVQLILPAEWRPQCRRATLRFGLVARLPGSLLAAWLMLVCGGLAQDAASELDGAADTGVRFVGNTQDLPPAAPAPAPAPADATAPPIAPMSEDIQPGVPRTLQQDEEALSAGQVELPSIRSLTVDIRPPAGDLPENTAATMFAQKPTIIVPPAQPAPEFKYTGFPRVSGICYHPLYFEEEAAERYGITRPLQPLCSFVHFFGTVPLLPLKMAVHPPQQWVCSGRYYPASNRPWLRQHPIARSVVTTGQSGLNGAIFLLP